MIKMKDAQLDGDSWEKLCQKCFRIKYEKVDYQEIPATYGGDLGIEGFTRNGIVFQCYAPEQDYPPKELYEHQRDKITTDIGKLIKNQKELKEVLGTIKIKKWCFVTPFYSNKDLLKHCNNKKEELKEQIRKKKYDHIDECIDIVILDSDCFLKEINLLCLTDNNYKLNIQVKHIKKENTWRECKSLLVQNLIRKISAVIPAPNSESGIKNVDSVVGIYMDYYLKGLKVLNLLQSKYPDYYEKLIELSSICENDVTVQCCMNGSGLDSNKMLFKTIIDEFGNKLKGEFGQAFSPTTIEELKNQIISSWLLNCPMDFR